MNPALLNWQFIMSGFVVFRCIYTQRAVDAMINKRLQRQICRSPTTSRKEESYSTKVYDAILQATHLIMRLDQIIIEDHTQMLWRGSQRQTHCENLQKNHQILRLNHDFAENHAHLPQQNQVPTYNIEFQAFQKHYIWQLNNIIAWNLAKFCCKR